MPYILALIVSIIAAMTFTPLFRRVAVRLGVVDRPDGDRKRHGRAVPLLGGAAVAASVIVGILIAAAEGWLPGEHIIRKYLYGIIAAIVLLLVGGVLDDRYDLPPALQFIWPILAALTIIVSGIGVTHITNPFGGLIHLDRHVVTVLHWGGIPYKLTLLADIFTLLWLLGMTYTTKFLDGVDGLVSGIAVIGGVIIAAVSMMQEVSQPDTAILALIVAGAFAGFLLFNFVPATVFLGEGGSTLAGFLLGLLAIVSGGKIATALLIFGLPIFDAAAVILVRIVTGQSPTKGDRRHLHFRLLDRGFTPRQAVLSYYLIAALFGTSTLFLRGPEKMVAIALLFAILLLSFAPDGILRKSRSGDRNGGTKS